MYIQAYIRTYARKRIFFIESANSCARPLKPSKAQYALMLSETGITPTVLTLTGSGVWYADLKPGTAWHLIGTQILSWQSLAIDLSAAQGLQCNGALLDSGCNVG